MLLAKVKDTIVSTQKNDKLVGAKFMICKVLKNGKESGDSVLAVDSVGAGIGETVLITEGSNARYACSQDNTPVDAVIIGIVDEGQDLKEY